MAISLKHAFASAKGDTPDATFIQPSHWNNEHVITCAANSVLGRTGTSGAVQEIATTAFGRTLMAAADAAAAKLALGIESFAAGTKMLFMQTTAPTGWTKDTTHNNKALRIVSGTAGSGGTTGFTTVFGARTIAEVNLPAHSHGVTDPGHFHSYSYAQGPNVSSGGGAQPYALNTVNSSTGSKITGISINNTGGGVAMDFAVQYVDAIIATKD